MPEIAFETWKPSTRFSLALAFPDAGQPNARLEILYYLPSSPDFSKNPHVYPRVYSSWEDKILSATREQGRYENCSAPIRA